MKKPNFAAMNPVVATLAAPSYQIAINCGLNWVGAYSLFCNAIPELLCAICKPITAPGPRCCNCCVIPFPAPDEGQ